MNNIIARIVLKSSDDTDVLTEQEINLMKKAAAFAYRDGVVAGITLYAWWKDDTQYVGSCGTTLAAALSRLEE